MDDKGTRRLGDVGSGDVTSSAGAGGRPTVVDDYDVEARIEAAVMAAGGDEESDTDPLIGRLVDNRFEIQSRLGAGGMGVVYRARQVGIDRVVAVKTLLKDRAQDQKVVQRFKNEARAVSRLNHPNTIRIHDFGQMDDGTLYFAMELLEGRSLDKAIKQDSPFSARRTLHVLGQMAESLAEAHSKGIVHRDLKPENVYLCHVSDDSDFVKVLDFGVAKLREADSSQGTVTQAGVIFGTPRYMAPEQCRTMAVDARADIYALGIICYEMLVGRTPFDADNALALLMKHLQDAVPPMASIRPDVDVPPDVEALIRKCLEKSPEKRFQSSAALAAEVRTLMDRLDGRYERVVFVERPPQAPVEVKDYEGEFDVVPARRKRPAALIAAMIGVIVLSVAGLAWNRYLREPVDETGLQKTGVASSGMQDQKKKPPASDNEAGGQAEPAKTGENVNGPVAVDAVDATVNVRLESEPAGATVFRGDTELGQAPLTVDLPRSDQEFSFEFVLEGYSSATMTSVLSRDVTLSAVLVSRLPAKSGEKHSAKQPAKQTSAASAVAVENQESPNKKPETVETVPARSGFEKVVGETASPAVAPNKVGDLKKF
jgi:serine/threonine-protein kinase